MIGWFGDWGYFNDVSNVSYIKNLSQFIVTDSHKPFTIGTNYVSGVLPENSSSSNGTISNGVQLSYNECAEALIQMLGNDYYTMYFCVGSINNNDSSYLTSCIASAYMSCPNLREGHANAFLKGIHIQSLKSLLVWDNSTGFYCRLYSVSEDGTLNYVAMDSPPSGQPIFNCAGSLFGYYIIPNYKSVKDLIDPKNYVNVSSSFYSHIGKTYRLGVITNCNSGIIPKLFSRGIAPDFEGNVPTDPNDPYGPGGDTGPGGGTGDFDGSSDSIDFPPVPALSAVDTGFITLFNPSLAELWNLSSYMWGDLFDVSTWKKIFADPMDAILGLSIVPVAVPNEGQGVVKVGNISTGVAMNKAASQYVAVDCGTLNVNEFWGAYLDYDPYTKAEIYLPYVGTHPLAVDDIMGKAVHVMYHVDILSGACSAYIKCGQSVLYTFVGQCSCSIPITGNDWTNVINGALSIAASIGSMVATGGATAPTAVPGIASTAINSLKPSVEKSGAIGGMGGMLGIQTPYLILTRPRQALPSRQNEYTGYPSFMTLKLSECSGYTEVEKIHLQNVPATRAELEEIEVLLKKGVII